MENKIRWLNISGLIVVYKLFINFYNLKKICDFFFILREKHRRTGEMCTRQPSLPKFSHILPTITPSLMRKTHYSLIRLFNSKAEIGDITRS